MTSLTQKTILGLKWQAVEVIGRQLLSLLVFTTLTRLLEPSAFGLVGMVLIYLAFVSMFIDQGISTALIQRKELEPQHLSTAFWFNLLCASLVCGLTIALSGTVARAFDEPHLQPLLCWAPLVLVLGSLGNSHNTIFLRSMDFRSTAMRTLVANVAGGITGLVMAFSGWGVWALIVQQLVSAAAGTIFLWSASTWRPTFDFSLRHLRDLFGMSSAVFATSLLWFISSRADQFFIGRFLGASALGIYTVGGKLPELARAALHQPLTSVAISAFSKLQDERQRLANAVYRGMSYVSLVVIPCFLGMAAIAPTAVPVVFGPQWPDAILPLQLLSVFILLNTLQVFFHPLLIATGGPGGYLLLNILHATGTIVACYVGVRVGTVGLIVGLCINTILVAIPSFAYLKSRLGLRWLPYWTPTIKPLVSSIAMYVTVTSVAWEVPNILSLALQISVGGAAYLGLMRLLSPSLFGDLTQLLLKGRLGPVVVNQ
jgi:O-antigen/teichoic acid export membrane protein